jgi:hypothetical protein
MIETQESVNRGLRIITKAYEDNAFLGDTVLEEIGASVSGGVVNIEYMDLLRDILTMIETIALIATVGILAGLIAIVFKYKKFSEERSVPEEKKIPEPASGGMLTGRWAEIMDHMQSERETEWKLAVIEADKLLNDILAKAGFPGETMGERLVGMRHEQLRTLPYLWQAHLLRNKIVHETNYEPKYQEIHEALKAYRASLEELGVL